jgi:hypothetical protein
MGNLIFDLTPFRLKQDEEESSGLRFHLRIGSRRG